MRISSLSIQHYRLLENVSIRLENDITLIVGRNNSGKSSLVDLCVDFLEKQNELRFVDFSKGCYSKFKEAYGLFHVYNETKAAGKSEEEQLAAKKAIGECLPKIKLEILIEYDKVNDTNLVGLSAFIMDLDANRNDALIVIEFSADDPLRLFTDYERANAAEAIELLTYLNKRIKPNYKTKVFAVDKNKREYKRSIDQDKWKAIEKVFITRSITAQRGVDDNTKDNKKTLGKGFERYYRNTKPNDDKAKIEKSLKTLSDQLEGDYNELFKNILKGLSTFGGATPTVIPEITIKSIFESEDVLSKNIHYFYHNGENILLPESYNGLGYSNLIFMVLQFASFFEEFKNREPKPEFLFLILEEPEAHMHPQMQQVFIKNIKEFLDKNGACAQVVITTHSSHILAESGIDAKKGFDRIRYFNKIGSKVDVKDLSGLTIHDEDHGETTKKFLRHYLTLNKCDLFFADKIILVEGPTERMLLPQMIKKISPGLQTQYISIIEVGGAYAHRFKELLEFIDVKALIVTDIDSVELIEKKDKKGKNRKSWAACEVKDSAKTCNAVLKNWLPKKELVSELLAVRENEKITADKKIRVAYQVPEEEGTKCGRSLEEAIILANAAQFSKNKSLVTLSEFFEKEASEIVEESFELTEEIVSSIKKTGFTFDLMLMQEWNVPKYFQEGLNWLASESTAILETAPLIDTNVTERAVARAVTPKLKEAKPSKKNTNG